MKRLICRIAALCIIAALPLVLTLARAQQPTAAPTSDIPEKAPLGWKQSDWNLLREQCLKRLAEIKAAREMTPQQLKGREEQLAHTPGYSGEHEYQELMACFRMVQQSPAPTSAATPGRTIHMPPPPPPLRVQILKRRPAL